MSQPSGQPENLSWVFDELKSQLALLEYEWWTFRTLFGSEKDRIELLNESAPFFFGVIQHVLFADCVMMIARLSDPSTTSGKGNLSKRPRRRK